MLTDAECEKIGRWKYAFTDRSIINRMMTPLWNRLVKLIPDYVAPNTITLVGFLCNLYSFHLVEQLFGNYPTAVTLLVLLLNFSYFTLDALDGKHARNTHNSSPVGELFDHVVDAVSTSFLMIYMCRLFGIDDPICQLLTVVGGNLVFLREHLIALRTGRVVFEIIGPSELLFAYYFVTLWHLSSPFSTERLLNVRTLRTLLLIIVAATAFEVRRLPDRATQQGLLIAYGVKFAELVAMVTGVISVPASAWALFCYGLYYTVPIADVIVCKMGQKSLSQWVPVLAIVSLFDPFINLIGVGWFVGTIFYRLSHYLHIPMFTPTTRVLATGVFDLCHLNHKKLFERAAKYGTRLVVGVHSDEEVESYKGKKPAVDHTTRCQEVAYCRYVDEVIPGAPVWLNSEVNPDTEDFLRRNRIHRVVCSDEYETDDDPYYIYPRQQGILIPIPRADGVSSTKLKQQVADHLDQ